MAVVQGDDPAQLARRAIEELGGIRRFISRGDVVVIKPNIAWDRTAEQAANTNPQVVAEVCRLCLEAGARRVIVTDVSINDPRSCFARSGIAAAARAAGAEVILPEERLFREVDLRGRGADAWPVLEPFLSADKMINIPIAKHHSLTGATLGMKNWYGILGGPRQRLHQHIHESLVDLADFHAAHADAHRCLSRADAERPERRKSRGRGFQENPDCRNRSGRPGRVRRQSLLGSGLAHASLFETGRRAPFGKR